MIDLVKDGGADLVTFADLDDMGSGTLLRDPEGSLMVTFRRYVDGTVGVMHVNAVLFEPLEDFGDYAAYFPATRLPEGTVLKITQE